ncbi:low molecular weight protein-tyrosine-phosphatase [Fusobacterium sp.]|uniref:low molecular weight protein-tyrosine-phosphatase n=1 Tax=Fusobacterium TaxID=848 RepID=UPI001F4F5795|nr:MULTISPECIES: low molecular weight protein-tyrosine-phosphatase [Fusobacterium]MCI5725411.1 low molecular weight phosphotyrosine protein phosphatase [Fusobacterium sp.]MDD7391734.1 low molecular weight phosphotyrosine protein phosphatase [Fusobacteriaceae bacterium]MDY5795155.1 low molecular weight protein-tyrosine-phosphatase [Fusobacterium gastrosuis]
MIKVLFVCHGNICRSTMAESVFTHMVKERKIENQFEIFSAGTSREEIGNPVHYGTVNKLKELSIPVVPHRAVQMTKEDLEYYDYIIAMDDNNIRNIERIIGGKNEKVKKLLSFTSSIADIADPWYTGDFDKTYEDIKKGLNAFLEKIN